MSVYDVNGNQIANEGSSQEKYPVIPPDNGIFNTCAALYSAYDAFVADGFATRTQIATVNDLPMYRYDFSAVNKWASGSANAEDTSGNKLYTKLQALFFSGLHGDEKGSPLYLYEFMKKACYDPAYCWVFALFDVHIVPIGNPYGFNANTRNNANNININRLDQSSNTVEAQALMAQIDSQAYDIFIDFHNTDSDYSNHNPGVTGAFSFANDMPSANMVKGYEVYLKATTAITRSLRKYWDMEDNNGVQNFLPWQGTENQTFRNYGFTHTSDNVTVGSPISACFEVSRKCYTYSNSSVEWNEKALTVGNTALNATLYEFLESVANEFLE